MRNNWGPVRNVPSLSPMTPRPLCQGSLPYGDETAASGTKTQCSRRDVFTPAGERDSLGGEAVKDQGQVAWGVEDTVVGMVLRSSAMEPTDACGEL